VKRSAGKIVGWVRGKAKAHSSEVARANVMVRWNKKGRSVKKKKPTPEQLAAQDEANRAHVQRMRTDPAYAKEYNAEQERLRLERSEQWYRKQQEKTQHQLKHHAAIKEMDDLLGPQWTLPIGTA